MAPIACGHVDLFAQLPRSMSEQGRQQALSVAKVMMNGGVRQSQVTCDKLNLDGSGTAFLEALFCRVQDHSFCLVRAMSHPLLHGRLAFRNAER